LQSEGVAVAQSEGEGDGPAGAVAAPACGVQDRAGLGDGEGFDLVVVEAGGIDEGAHVAGDASALHRDLQCPRQKSVRLQHRRGGEPFGGHGGVEAFDVLGLQAVEAVVPDTGDDVDPREGPVPLQRRGSDAAGGDVVEVLGHPHRDRRRCAGGQGRAGVAFGLQGADLGDDLAAGRR
jgi:hypothetical protein